MRQSYFFGKAKWIGAKTRTKNTFSVLKGYFYASQGDSVSLNVLGLGFFKCYINGQCINPDTFLPLSSDYEPSCDPVDEVLSGHRIYVPNFDITPFIKDGKNVITIHYGGGWYTHKERTFGLPKAIYNISVKSVDGVRNYVSNEDCLIGKSFVDDYDFTRHEKQDYSNYNDCSLFDFDDDNLEPAYVCEQLDTDYLTTDCPIDKLIATLPVKTVGNGKQGIVYDCGQNATGYPVLKINAKRGEEVKVIFSELLDKDGDVEDWHSHCQNYVIVSNGQEITVQPEFTWFGFRYFKVIGDAVPVSVKFIHADVKVNSSFDCDNQTLNWIYKTFIDTMHCNMHTGHPCDCPHIERRGYTGDGQLTCHTVLSIMDAKSFYEKWLQDIADCQDTLSGHIQYTAPYIRSGGGPGGWGCAIVEVPYQLYRHYGDKQILAKYYDNMRRYIDYLEAHSKNNLVISDKKGEWCLGDWCGPIILYPDKDITSHNQQVFIPAPFVNTYFMVKSLLCMVDIATVLGKTQDIKEYQLKIAERKEAIEGAYYNTFDYNFVMNIQGANVYGVDIGVGSDKSYKNIVNYYTKLGHYDTGIFGTDILTRLLFERGNSDLAIDLLTNDGDQGFEHWRKNGATTFHEYWDSNRSRSHSHPMFGAPVAYLFEYLLGIRQPKNTAGYNNVIIEPVSTDRFKYMQGHITTPNGKLAVKYQRQDGKLQFNILIPKGTKAIFKHLDKQFDLVDGENIFDISI